MASNADTLPIESILDIATSLRADGASPSFCFSTAERPLPGKQCSVYVVTFPDAVTWAVRVPVHSRHLPPESATDSVEIEAAILKRLQTNGIPWSPRLIGCDSNFDNLIRFPYMVLSWIEGTPLEWSDMVPADRESRNKIIRQMVDIIAHLESCTEEVTGVTASQYLIDMIDRKTLRAINGQLPGIPLRDCFILQALAHKALYPESQPFSFVISHGDLAGQNIIVDSDYNIKGIIDWGFASLLPFQLAVSFPRFLAVEPPQIDIHQPDNFAVFTSALLKPSAVLQTDHSEFLSYLSSRGWTGPASVNQSILSMLSALDVDWRCLVFEAASSKCLHRRMAERSWLFGGSRSEWDDIQRNTVPEEVKRFLAGSVGRTSRLDFEMLTAAMERERDSVEERDC